MEQSSTSFILMMVMIAGIFYFLMYRPQAKKNKERSELLNSLSKGDEVLLSGGLMGTIIKLNEQFAVIALNENLNVTVKKEFIVSILPKGTLKSI